MTAISYNMKKAPMPIHRSEFIDLRLRQFIDENRIYKWPLDCVVLLRQIKESGRYGIQKIAVLNDLSEGVDAVTQYQSGTRQYSIWFNRKKLRYPFQKSFDRRLNFTAAHEIGHIVLEHLLLSKDSKTDTETHIEDLEADEFAARLLMPRELVCSFNYYSLETVASWLNVSNSALTTRLHCLNRADLILSRKIKSCTQCGNIRFSSFASHCGVCSRVLRKGELGVRRIYYPDEIAMDSCKRSLVCPNCHNTLNSIKGKNCSFCQTSIFNLCSNGCACSYANLAYARFCEICGKPTCYQQDGFFSNWQSLYESYCIAKSTLR
ncbi:MAG TPA: Zn peptidase [Clostridiales bacterium]|nr:Zn peptidase [Clostridiales bacterium]